MYLGGLVEVSDTQDLFSNPAHPYTRMLLDAVPSIAQVGRERQPVQGEIPNPINPPSGCVFHPRCPFANDRCKAEVPKSITVAGRSVACHAVEEGRLDVEEAA
jgi:peptide/nickel transport system ATP-binding protein